MVDIIIAVFARLLMKHLLFLLLLCTLPPHLAAWDEIPKPKTLPPDTGSIGIVAAAADDGLQVIDIFAGGPADTAGVLLEDKILAIDGKILKELKHPVRIELLRGKAGTEVVLTISRGDPKIEVKLTLKRVAMKDLDDSYLKKMR